MSSTPADLLADLTLEQRVGQLFMVGVDVANPSGISYDLVEEYHVGNVFLHGRSQDGVDATADLVESFTFLVNAESTGALPMFVATDQEGGAVQVLRGPGFTDIPAAIDQAADDPADTEAAATTWGAELAAAGINLNLAPVMDLVPDPARADSNAPIGAFGRQYGYTPEDVAAHANAFSAGMMANGVDVAIKHFPGLGRVTKNTDTAQGVTDDEVTADGPDVAIFASGIDAGAAFVMMSTAVYANVDPEVPAAFSPAVVTDLLRGDLGFDGVVITDDVSAADQVQPWSPAQRAIVSIEAGVDMVLVSAEPSVAAEMVNAVVAKAEENADFAALIDAAVLRVATAKQRLG